MSSDVSAGSVGPRPVRGEGPLQNVSGGDPGGPGTATGEAGARPTLGSDVAWLTGVGVAALIALTLARLHSYNLFHTIAELFSVIVAMTIFLIAWHTRRLATNSYFVVVGAAFLSVGTIDLLHALSYQGMGVFEGFDTDLPTQLWLSARYLQTSALLIAPLLVTRTVRMRDVLPAFSIAAVLLLAAIFWWDVFPVAFVEGEGLTTFKVASEYVISGLLVAALVTTIARREHFEDRTLAFIAVAITFIIASELAFTLYVEPTGSANLIGHYLKILAFIFIYKALVEVALERPYEVLFRDLKSSEEALRASEGRYRQIADSLQESILTMPGDLPGVSYGHLYRSATLATRVGGDFYDLFSLPDGRVGVTVGDVSGKGLQAATVTALVKDTIRAYALDGSSPEETMHKTNLLLEQSLDRMSFVTAFFGIVDGEREELSYCSAGHPPAIVRREDGSTDLLDDHSPVLGAFPDSSYEGAATNLTASDLLVLYTDGVLEARRGTDGGEFYGEERLLRTVLRSGDTSAETIPLTILTDVVTFAEGTLNDDVALLALAPAPARTGQANTPSDRRHAY